MSGCLTVSSVSVCLFVRIVSVCLSDSGQYLLSLTEIYLKRFVHLTSWFDFDLSAEQDSVHS